MFVFEKLIHNEQQPLMCKNPCIANRTMLMRKAQLFTKIIAEQKNQISYEENL